MTEERTMYFHNYRVRLVYSPDGRSARLHMEDTNSDENIMITSTSHPMAPETIYELMRECDIDWTGRSSQ